MLTIQFPEITAKIKVGKEILVMSKFVRSLIWYLSASNKLLQASFSRARASLVLQVMSFK